MKKSFGQENEFISDFIQQGVSTFFRLGLVHNMNLKNVLWNRCGLSTTLSNETSAANQAASYQTVLACNELYVCSVSMNLILKWKIG